MLTTPLGVGLATLMREPSRKKQQYLLDVAYDVGYRHFDVAPSYGLGSAEVVLGRFLRRHSEGVTVATKVGIQVRVGSLARFIERPARLVLQRFPSLRGSASSAVGGALHARPNFSRDSCSASLDASLRALNADYVDLLLLHGAQPSDLNDGAALDWLDQQKERGRIRNCGIATTAEAATEIVRQYPGRLDAIQTPSSLLERSENLPNSPGILRVTYGAIGPVLSAIDHRTATDPLWSKKFSSLSQVEVRNRQDITNLLIACALSENPRGVVLIGSSKAEHLRSAASVVDHFAAARAKATAEFLRQSFAVGGP